MDIEARVRRIERWVIGDRDGVRDAIRRDIAAEEAASMEAKRPDPERLASILTDNIMERDMLIAHCCDLIEKSGAAKPTMSALDEGVRALIADRDAAIARAEKAERERDAAVLAQNDKDRALCQALRIRDELRAQLTARDATIAEARKRISGIASWLRDNGHNWPWPEGHSSICFCCVQVRECDAWLAGQPAPAAHSCEAAEKVIEHLEAELAAARAEIALLTEQLAEVTGANDLNRIALRNARAEVARLEGLRAQCETWLELLSQRPTTPTGGFGRPFARPPRREGCDMRLDVICACGHRRGAHYYDDAEACSDCSCLRFVTRESAAHAQSLAAAEKAVVDAAVREHAQHNRVLPGRVIGPCECQLCLAVDAFLALRGAP